MDNNDNFDLILDSVAPGTLKASDLPLTPSAPPPSATQVDADFGLILDSVPPGTLNAFDMLQQSSAPPAYEPQTDMDFDLPLDSVPPGTVSAPDLPHVAPAPHAYVPPPMQTLVPPVYVPSVLPAEPVMYLPVASATPLVPGDEPAYAAVAAVESAPATALTYPPKRSRRGAIVAIVLLLLAVNGVVVAHRYGLITFPDLTSGGKEKSVPPPTAQAKGPATPGSSEKAEPTGGNTNPAPDNPNPGNPNPGNPNPGNPNPGNPAPGNPPPQNNPPPAQPKARPRPFKGPRDILAAVQGHLLRVPEADRRFQRYFTLAPLYNDPALSEKQLDQYRAALAALVRHLQPSKGAVRIEPIDPARTVLCLDLRAAGWEKLVTWREILKVYPYGVLYSEGGNTEAADLAKEITELTSSDMPMVSLDWFLAAASQSPLREQLGPDADGQLPAAVAALAARYREGVRLDRAARELGLPDARLLREAVQTSDRLRELGLGAFLNGAAVPRERWGTLARTASLYQEAAQELSLGSPLRVRR